MNYSSLFTVAGLLAGLQIALVLVSVVASTVSLVHALKESTKRASIIVFSALGLGFGLLGLLFGLIFAILGLVFTIISMTQDRKPRHYIVLVISIVAITGTIGFGFSYYMKQATKQIEDGMVGPATIQGLGSGTDVNQFEYIGSETIQNLGSDTDVQYSTDTYSYDAEDESTFWNDWLNEGQ